MKVYILNFSRYCYAELPDWEYRKMYNLIKEIGMPETKPYPEFQIMCNSVPMDCMVTMLLSEKHDIHLGKQQFSGNWPTEENPARFPEVARMVKILKDAGSQVLIIVCESNYDLPKHLPEHLAEELGMPTDIFLNGSHVSQMLEINIGDSQIKTRYIYDGSSSD
ncbi:MAG: hypothetical protein WCI79_02955 [Candidatus Saccharibacteria bacterium]